MGDRAGKLEEDYEIEELGVSGYLVGGVRVRAEEYLPLQAGRKGGGGEG